MPEALLLLIGLLVLGVIVLLPLRRPVVGVAVDAERDAAAVRHRVSLESLRDVEADRRAGSLDERGYVEQLAEAEARAAATAAELDATREPPAEPHRARIGPAVVAAAVIGFVLVAGSLVPALGVGNSTQVNEQLAAQQDAETARQAEIDRLLGALEADPEDPETLSELADAFLAGSTADDLSRAAAALQVLIALEPDRADAYERIVSAYLRAGDYADGRSALESYEDIATADPVELAFFDGLIALNGEDDPERAIGAFDRFLELAPDDPRAPMVRGLRAEAEAASGS
jgi:cytochrome c-type biogenesis protein CcmH/NrfG